MEAAQRLGIHGRRVLLHRAQALARLSRAPGEHVARASGRGCTRASARSARRAAQARGRRARAARRALVLDRKAHAAPLDARRATGLRALALALDAHDPQRTVERGYAMVTDREGELVTSADGARAAGDVSLRFGDGAVDATISDTR